MMHTIKYQSWNIVNDFMGHEVMTSSLNNFSEKIDVRIPESSYHITNNSLSLVL